MIMVAAGDAIRMGGVVHKSEAELVPGASRSDCNPPSGTMRTNSGNIGLTFPSLWVLQSRTNGGRTKITTGEAQDPRRINLLNCQKPV
jgi:hypothetical protein